MDAATQAAGGPTDSIESSGYPLGFKVRTGTGRPGALGLAPARDVFTVEARQFGGHQKEAVIHEGATGSAWRCVSDEGRHLKGTDLAPFPLGFFNAGLHGDIGGRIVALARARDIAIDGLAMDIVTAYSLTGSFTRGDATGYGEPVTIEVKIDSPAPAKAIAALVADALDASPAIAALRDPLVNTFAIYVNGRRRPVSALKASPAGDAPDPYRTYTHPPAPLGGAATLDPLIRKTGQNRDGTPSVLAPEAKTRTIRQIFGTSTMLDPGGVFEIDTVLGVDGASHFAMRTDERPDGDQAPCGLSLLASAIVYCYMTQISRFIEHMRLDIGGTRLVQSAPYAICGSAQPKGTAEPVDTHLFLNGAESEASFENLQLIAARTCYLHATLIAPIERRVSVTHNGRSLG